MHVVAAVVLAALTSVANAASATLQWHATSDAPSELQGVGLARHLLRRREYLLAIGALVVSFLLQAAALHEGDLALVQPLLVLELPFTLLLASAWLGVGLDRREVLGAVAIGLGLALLLGAGAPHGGREGLPAGAWLMTAAVTVVVLTLLVTGSSGSGPVRRAVLLSAAAGVEFSVTALLVKAVTDRVGGGLGHLLLGWPVYAMAAAGILAVLLQQQGFRAGPIAAAKPSTTIATTAGSIVIGLLVLHEHLRGGVALLPELVGVAVLLAGIIELARSPLIGDGGRPEPVSVPVGVQDEPPVIDLRPAPGSSAGTTPPDDRPAGVGTRGGPSPAHCGACC